MYAGDVKIYLSVFDLASHALLQDLNRIVAWAVKLKLKLNAKKMCLASFEAKYKFAILYAG